jgi:hypothetical protein
MNTIIETAISVVLIVFVFSVIAYVIQELIAVNLQFRSKMLWKSMAQLLDGFVLEGRLKLTRAVPAGNNIPLTQSLYDHAQIKTLQQHLRKMPSYIPASHFAMAIIDIVAAKSPTQTGNLMNDFSNGLATLTGNNAKLKEILGDLKQTSATLQELQDKLAAWFDNYMNRVSGWYKSHTVVFVRLIAIGLTLFFNLNMIRITKTIYNNGTIRGNLVAIAETMANNPESTKSYYTAGFSLQVSAVEDQFKKDTIGKTDDEKKNMLRKQVLLLDSMAGVYTKKSTISGKAGSTPFINFCLLLIGWLISAGAISMGAPFWFDMLVRLVNLRQNGATRQSSKK